MEKSLKSHRPTLLSWAVMPQGRSPQCPGHRSGRRDGGGQGQPKLSIQDRQGHADCRNRPRDLGGAAGSAGTSHDDIAAFDPIALIFDEQRRRGAPWTGRNITTPEVQYDIKRARASAKDVRKPLCNMSGTGKAKPDMTIVHFYNPPTPTAQSYDAIEAWKNVSTPVSIAQTSRYSWQTAQRLRT